MGRHREAAPPRRRWRSDPLRRSRRAHRRAEIGEARLEQSQASIRSLEAHLEERQEDLELLQREAQAFRERAEVAEKRALEAEQTHSELLQRFVAEKQTAAERINQLNEEVERLRAALRRAGVSDGTEDGDAAEAEAGGDKEEADSARDGEAQEKKQGWASTLLRTFTSARPSSSDAAAAAASHAPCALAPGPSPVSVCPGGSEGVGSERSIASTHPPAPRPHPRGICSQPSTARLVIVRRRRAAAR